MIGGADVLRAQKVRLLSYMSLPPLIWDDFHAEKVPPEGMDALLVQGWRHFGTQFFRYSVMLHEGECQTVVPLRVELEQFSLSKSQRRVLRKNADLRVEFTPARLTEEAQGMFQRHKSRFTENVPEELTTFLSAEPGTVPCECLAVECHLGEVCIAISFMDVGSIATSSVYGVFEPVYESRSLGIFTMLREIQWAKERGMQFVYPGYATLGSSHYDYKKQFAGLQGYHWETDAWLPWQELVAESAAVATP